MADLPPSPRPSPRPDIAPELEREEPTNPRIKRSNHFTRLVSLGVAGGFSVATLATVAVAYRALAADAKDAGTAAAKVELAPVVEAVKGHEARMQVLEQTSKQTQADVHEARGELRDLYKAVMEGKRSEKLERPVPPLDGGHP